MKIIIKYLVRTERIYNKNCKRFSESLFCEVPKKISKSQVSGTEIKFIAIEKEVSIVFRHVMFCVTQAVTSFKFAQNL